MSFEVIFSTALFPEIKFINLWKWTLFIATKKLSGHIIFYQVSLIFTEIPNADGLIIQGSRTFFPEYGYYSSLQNTEQTDQGKIV